MGATHASQIAALRKEQAAQRATLDSVVEQQARILALLEANAPAKAVTPQPKADRKAKKAPQPKADRTVVSASHTFLGERVGTGSRKLTKANRQAFIAAHAWAKPGMSTNALRSEVAAGRKVNKGWNVAI